MSIRNYVRTPQHLARALSVLLVLFILRVLGQLLVVCDLAPFLPSLARWQSGLLPYPALLASQIVLISIMSAIVYAFMREEPTMIRQRPVLGSLLLNIGFAYAFLMTARAIMYVYYLFNDTYFMGGWIPIAFHFVLATFILLVGTYHVHEEEQSYTTAHIHMQLR